jgi:hypothetical protein
LANLGTIHGLVQASPDVLRLANATDFSGATATAYDPDGKKLTDAVTVNSDGTFTMSGLKQSRPRIFIEVNLKTINFRAVAQAPRTANGDYQVRLDPGSTFLADKLHRAMIDQELPFDRLEDQKVDDTEEVVNLYLGNAAEFQTKQDTLTRGTMTDASGQAKMDLNANLFDRFTDTYPAVKLAMFALAPGVLRGWKPSPSPRGQAVDVSASGGPPIVPGGGGSTAPTPTPSASASADPTAH